MNTKSDCSRSVARPRHYGETTRLHRFAKTAVALLLLLLVTAHIRAQSALDGFDPKPNGQIRIVVVQPDGKILIGGDFTSVSPNGGAAVTRNRIARLNPDGTLDAAFNPNANGGVYTIVVQADGKILVGGYFTGVGGQPRNRIARLDATTGLADSFDPNANEGVYTIAVQADGKILAGGFFHGTNSIGGQTRDWFARLDPTTGLADSFDPHANFFVYAIVVQADGKILVGGAFGGPNSIGGKDRNCIARLDPTTGLADSFNGNAGNPGTNSGVTVIALQADGKVLVAGRFTIIGGQSRKGFARLDPTTGSADSFDPNLVNTVPGYEAALSAIMIQADGKILVGGFFTDIGGQTRHSIARLDPTTGQADSFDPNAAYGGSIATVFAIAAQADGKLVVGGSFSRISGQTRNNLARLETDGRADQTLDANLNFGVNVFATATQPDGKILIGGQFTQVLGVNRINIARLNADGTLDAGFQADTSGIVRAIALQTDGQVLVGGEFTNVSGVNRNNIARLDRATGLPDSFDPDANGTINSIAVQTDGKILAAGDFNGANSIGGQTRNRIARLDPETGLADSFDPDANFVVQTIAVQADGKILAGGDFHGTNSIGGQSRNFIARLDPVTGLADSFDPNANETVYAIAVQADGAILAGGVFDFIGGQPRRYIARLDATSGLVGPSTFNPNPDGRVQTIAVQADGKILAGGFFGFFGGATRNHIARVDQIFGLADSFDANANQGVSSIAVQADGKILAGGSFTTIGGQPRNLFARLSNDTASLQDLAVSQTTITWARGGSSPDLARVTFEYSTDNVNYTPAGNGTAAGRNWTLSGLSLPIGQNFYIRARGYYRGGYQNGSESITASVRNVFIFPPSTLGNIATRLRVQTGDNAMIGGFIITGTQPKTVIVRGIGPSLPIPGALADPVIEVHGSTGQLLATNDNWNDSLTRQQIIDSGLAPANDLESALWGIISPGAYTVVVRGKNDTTGIGLFEVYDLDQTVDSKLGNISTRGFVETGDNVMIGGTIIMGNVPARVLLRAIGPSLANFGVPNALGDPTLELHDGNGGLIAANDNWRTDQESEIIATGIAPSNNLESAIVRDLLPGSYTAIVRGAGNTTGVAVIEAYALN
jgi:uncharacterized delta-60 repeat protein